MLRARREVNVAVTSNNTRRVKHTRHGNPGAILMNTARMSVVVPRVAHAGLRCVHAEVSSRASARLYTERMRGLTQSEFETSYGKQRACVVVSVARRDGSQEGHLVSCNAVRSCEDPRADFPHALSQAAYIRSVLACAALKVRIR